MSENRPANTVSIQALANTCGVSRSTIMRMETEGLLNPIYIDPYSGYRYYNVDNLAQVVRVKNYQALGFKKKEISEFITNPDVLKNSIRILTEKYDFYLRELDRISVMNSTDGHFIIRQQEYLGGHYLHLSKSMVFSPQNVWRYIKDSLEYFMSIKLSGIPEKTMHISIDDDDHIGYMDGREHVCSLLIPVNQKSFPGEEIIYLPPAKSLILSCNCSISNYEHYFHTIWNEALRLGYKPKGNVRIICFPEIISYSRSEDNVFPMMLALLVE